MAEMTIELRRKIAERLGVTTHSVRRTLQKGGQPLAAHHRAALEEFGTEVADLLCPVRERAKKGEKPRKKPVWAEVLTQMDETERKIKELSAQVEQAAAKFAAAEAKAVELGLRVDRLEARAKSNVSAFRVEMSTVRTDRQWRDAALAALEAGARLTGDAKGGVFISWPKADEQTIRNWRDANFPRPEDMQ